jgi:DeoR/GlpR family transcriptional regulator of sugar metabolism
MLAAERHARIADIVSRNKSVTLSELRQQFAVSDMTIRRDLQRLEDEGVLVRTHGGAVASLSEQETAYGIREQAHPESKEAIARVAASLVNPGDTIILDAGTTTARLSRRLHGKARLTVITTSLHVLRELGGDHQVTLIATGGTVRPATLSFVGSWAEEMLSRFHADALFLAATAVDLGRGLYNSNVFEIGVKQQMIRSARRVILVADHSKFGRQSTAKIAALDQVHCIVTDSQVAPDVPLALRDHHIEVRFASLHR